MSSEEMVEFLATTPFGTPLGYAWDDTLALHALAVEVLRLRDRIDALEVEEDH